MPSAAQYIIDPNSKEAQPIERAYVKERAARTRALGDAWRYYDGDMARPLRPDRTRVDDNVIVNLVELLVEKGVSNLFGTDEVGEVEGVEFQVVASPVAGDSLLAKARRMLGIDPAARGTAGTSLNPLFNWLDPSLAPQRWLDSFWRANKKNLLLHDIGLSGGLAGHVFVKLVPDTPFPRLVNLDPFSVSIFWDENDMDRVLWYRIQYSGQGGLRRQDIVRSEIVAQEDREAPWLIYDYSQAPKTKKWTLDGVVEWPYPWPPIIDWKNLPRPNHTYGKNDIGQNGRLNDSLNFIIGNIQRILKNHANPKSIGTGFSADKLSEAQVGSLWVIDNPDAKIFNLEMQSDLTSSLAFAQLIRRAFFDSGRELDPATVQDRLGDLTNFGLRVLYKDVLGKNTTRRLHYGDGLRRICGYALALAGFGAGIDVNVVWPDPLPNDPLPTAQALQLDVSVGGLSKTTYLRRRGYDPDQEAGLRAQDVAGGDPQGGS